ncbi:gliding motility-associated C-terminal domain-containing protein [Lewinella sp. LCG006]|uniref:T9SS type B sorting domain-containing protein n=1 Tax=Lewinella sp. LCG006 TaxID=3231911 RepID=UPI00345FE410
MRKLYTLLIMVLAPLAALLAQPTIIVGNGSACTGETFCVPVTTQDFTNINSLDFDFGYDPAVLNFTGAQNFNAQMQSDGNLGPALFDGSMPGVISFGTWETGNCLDPGNLGTTLADDVDVLFELCFEAIGSYGQQSPIGINPFPTPNCTRNSTGCTNIGLLRQNGNVTLCVREFNVTADDVTGNEGDQVCVDFVVEGWDGLNGIQFTVNYDPAFLQFENLFPNTEIPSNTLAAYGFPPLVETPGVITVAYSYTVPNSPSPIVADGTTMFTACFTILGACETGSLITFSDTPTPIQVNNEDPDNPNQNADVPVSLNPGSVLVNDCDPDGIVIKIDCGAPVNVNDIVCVEFAAGDNFNAVRRMEYLMSWNPNVLEYVQTNSFGNLAGFSVGGNIDASNAGNGILGLNWSFIAGPPQNMDDMEPIYEVCFRVVGVGGDSPVQIITPGVGVSNGVNIGINPMNCVVQVNQPESVVVDFGNIDATLGGSGCSQVTVSNFTELLNMQFTMAWDENIWLHNGTIQNVNPAIGGANPTFTPIGLSSMGFSIDNGATPITLTDNSVLFEICFDTAPTASPGDCDELNTVGLPFPETAVTATSNGDNIGLLVNPGTLCVLFPEGFGLEAVSTTGGWLDTVCMNFTVESFDNITDADFNINWNPLALEFVSATAINWTGLSLMNLPTGTINGTFSSPIPLAIPDGDVAFEVCFQLIGDPDDCYDVTIQNEPAPQVQTTNGPGSIVITNGEICIEDQIVITDIEITPPSCPGACDGTIVITVAEHDGQGFIGTTWRTDNPAFDQFTPLILEDVCEGMTIFTVFDNSSGVSLTDTVFIVSDGIVPEAVINGADVRELDCNAGLVQICTSSGGPGFTTNWYYNSVSGSPDGNTTCFFGDAPGTVILEVIDQVSGCSATDTVMVVAPTLPEAIVPVVTEEFDCNTGSITLDGSNSIGNNLTYVWEYNMGPPDGFVTVGTGMTYDATLPGTYRLTVQNSVTGCRNSIDDPNDVVTIGDGRIAPGACVEEENGGSRIQEQNCDGTPIVFSASCSDTDGQIVDYNWYEFDEVNGTFGADLGNGLTVSANEQGVYAVEIINITTGCRDTAFAEIIPNSSAPGVTIDEPAAIDCNTTSVILNAELTPNDPTFTFVWEATMGGTLQAPSSSTLQPEALTPGTYTITVTNPDNLCEAVAFVVVEDQTAPPFVEILNDPADLGVDCNTPENILRATPSDILTYQWCLDTQDPSGEIENANADTLIVSNGGWYYVKATNPATGCTAVDSIFVPEQFETPSVILSDLEPVITCTDPTVTVTATIQGSTDFTLREWESDPMEAIDAAVVTPDGLSITVSAAGVYTLTAVSNLSGCTGEADFVVTVDTLAPNANVTNDTLTINCAATTVQLSGAGSSTGQDFTYLWENQDGDGPDDPTTAIQTTTSIPGTYIFTVTDNSNGCTADTMVVVTEDIVAPMLSIADVDPITCQDPSRQLTVEVAGATEFTVTWTGDPTDPMPTNQATTTAIAPGVYSVTVVDGTNGCPATASVTVDGDITPPTITIATPDEFDCPTEFVVIDATATGVTDDFSQIKWSLDNGVLTGEEELTLNATELGTYTLMVTSAANGCTNMQDVEVVAANELTLPELPVLMPADLDCDATPVVIDASAADDGTFTFANVDWSTADGIFTLNTPFSISATAVGTYTLMVTIDSPVPGCEATADYTVNADPNVPVADAGMDMVAGCGTPVMLDGTASTPASATVTYEWVTLSGTALTGDTNGATPTAENAGTYQLTVTNTENGCEAVSEVVTVTFEFPADANAGADDAACDDITDLSANLPANTQGVWTTASGASIDMITEPLTMVSGLNEGANTFTWTLSAPGCPDYSSDDVTINRATTPVANQDALTLEAGVSTGTVNLLANDQLGGITNFDLTILTSPTFGTFDTMALAQGDFVLTLLPTEFGVTTVTYQVCSTDCPDLCATSTLEITALPSEENFIPNTITPNGDGANDQLVFDILLFNPAEDFPDNEIVIFNRWGDIIYEAKPYNNDWSGLNMDGTEIPEGTYYYVLRLNISRGNIIRGDITVIR